MEPKFPAEAYRELSVFGMPVLRALSLRQLRVGTLIFVAYLAAMRLGSALFVAPAVIFPAAGIAAGALFLEGAYLWPFVYASSFVGYVLNGSSLVTLLIMPVAHTLAALVASLTLKALKVDPILRRSRDMFSIIFVALTASTIVPTIGQLSRFLNQELYGMVPSIVTWGSWWTGLVLSLLILTPFVLRWFAKPHFTRTFAQAMETVIVVGSIAFLAYLLYWTPFTSLNGVSLEYVLFLPLFWVALRLGPRFLTLSLLLLSSVAIMGVYFSGNDSALGVRLLQTEIFLDIIAIIFFVVVTIEEERRMATKLLTSQIGSLRVALDQLADQDRAKNEFVAMIAHELRNPLTPVVASLELLQEKTTDEESRKTMTFMNNCLMTAKRLLEDLLDVSRMNQSKLVLKREPTDLSSVIRHAVASRQHTMKERTHTLTLSVPEGPVMVDGDSVRLEQIVMNLLVNASKFTDPGGRISVTLTTGGAFACIKVTDSGVGIDPSMLERIFEPFAQVEQGERTRKGLGIGLALVRQLADMHGGSVRAESPGPGHGSTFLVEIPLMPQAAPAATSRLSIPGLTREPAKRGTILIVDDNDAAAYAVGRLLELKGYAVEYAYDGTHALERADEVKPSSILLDIGLPDMDGFAVAKALRANGYTGNLVALTGYGSDEERQKAIEVGFDHHLVKPVGIAELRRVL